MTSTDPVEFQTIELTPEVIEARRLAREAEFNQTFAETLAEVRRDRAKREERLFRKRPRVS